MNFALPGSGMMVNSFFAPSKNKSLVTWMLGMLICICTINVFYWMHNPMLFVGGANIVYSLAFANTCAICTYSWMGKMHARHPANAGNEEHYDIGGILHFKMP